MTARIRPTLHGSQLRGAPLTLVEKAQLAAKHGYAAVDFSFAEAAAYEQDGGSVPELLASVGVEAGTVGGLVGFSLLEPGEDLETTLVDLPARARQVVAWGGTVTGAGIPMRTTLPLDTAWPLAVARLRRLDETVRDTGLRLGLEFLGVQTLHPDRGPFFIHTLAAALDLLEDAQVEASGLTVDSYHCHASGATFKQLRQTPAERITLLHINDAKPVPLEDLDDQDRLMPGEGIIDLAGWLQAIAATGFDGTVALEVLGPRLDDLDSEACAQQGIAALRSVFAEAGLSSS